MKLAGGGQAVSLFFKLKKTLLQGFGAGLFTGGAAGHPNPERIGLIFCSNVFLSHQPVDIAIHELKYRLLFCRATSIASPIFSY